MKALGLRIQLGHPFGHRCHNPDPAFADSFTLLDVDGIHDLAVDFCGCSHIQTHAVQLLRLRWWPATTINPKTAATFWLLEWFHVLGNQSKVSAYEYFTSLTHRTDNIAISLVKVSLCSSFTNIDINKVYIGPLFCISPNDTRMGAYQTFKAMRARS